MGKTDESNDATPEPVKNLHVEVPVSFHRRLKMLCVVKDSTMQDYSRTAIEEKVARDEEEMRRENSE